VTINEDQGPIAAGQLRKVFEGKIVAAGGFQPDTAEAAIASGAADAVAFGRHFVANPDLPLRIREGLALARYDRNTTSVRLEVEQIQLVGKWRRFFLGALIVEGPQNGRFLEKGDAENL
jgi:2,4-dienoyl-CoA reductase-like NADH-dependent reductase (Old Yellow Enzyme family)